MSKPYSEAPKPYTEMIVEHALKCLEAEGDIKGWEHYPPSAPEDHQGIDFRIFTHDKPEGIPIQVKGKASSSYKHHKRYGWNIPVISVRTHSGARKSLATIKRQIRELTNGLWAGLFEGNN